MNTTETRIGRETGMNMRQENKKTAARGLTAPRAKRAAAMSAAMAAWIVGCAWGQDYGHDFVTVGAPGNRATLPSEMPWRPERSVGSVGYEFRITRTEVLTSQWYDFVVAYAPFWPGSPNDSRLTGSWVRRNADGQGYGYGELQGTWPIDVYWETAARYCNWLHNGRVNEAWAFESGAYDTSTFTQNQDGSYNHQPHRSENARFWIPSYDEIIKAFYYDPNKHGVGQEGYWLYVNRSDQQPIEALPEQGGTTNSGLGTIYSQWGQYPLQTSPWGLLDTSGGENEWSETSDIGNGSKLIWGSTASGGGSWYLDRVDFDGIWTPAVFGGVGFRVASTIPVPGIAAIGAVSVIFVFTRRSR